MKKQTAYPERKRCLHFIGVDVYVDQAIKFGKSGQ
jgi:hypothetical protein